MKFNRAFTLLELMVVVGIIALLATIAVPYYNEYTNQSKVALAALILNDYNTQTIALYNEGQVYSGMTSIEIEGTTFNDGSSVSISLAPVTSVQFYAPGDGTMSDNEWMFCGTVAGLDYSGVASYTSGNYTRLCSKVVVNNGIFTTYCGSFSSDSQEIPANFLPAQCNATNISAD